MSEAFRRSVLVRIVTASLSARRDPSWRVDAPGSGDGWAETLEGLVSRPATAGAVSIVVCSPGRADRNVSELRPGGHGLIVGSIDAVLGLGKRTAEAEWRWRYPPHSVFVGSGGAAAWITRGLRSTDPRLIAIR